MKTIENHQNTSKSIKKMSPPKKKRQKQVLKNRNPELTPFLRSIFRGAFHGINDIPPGPIFRGFLKDFGFNIFYYFSYYIPF